GVAQTRNIDVLTADEFRNTNPTASRDVPAVATTSTSAPERASRGYLTVRRLEWSPAATRSRSPPPPPAGPTTPARAWHAPRSAGAPCAAAAAGTAARPRTGAATAPSPAAGRR